MSTDNYHGGIIIKQEVDQEEIKAYDKMIRALSIEQFIDLYKVPDLNTPYDQYHMAARTKLYREYHREATVELSAQFQLESLHKYTTLDRKVYNWMYALIQDRKYNSTMRMRMHKLHKTVEQFQPIHKSSYTCVVFTILQKSAYPSNYAYLYIQSDKNVHKSVVTYKYMCIGPNMISADGEYRNGVTPIQNINEIRLEYIELWEEIEEYLVDRKDIKYTQNYYLAHGIDKVQSLYIKKDVEVHRFAILLLVMAWSTQYVLLYMSLQNTHIDPSYNNNMFTTTDAEFFQHLVDVYSLQTLKQFYNRLHATRMWNELDAKDIPKSLFTIGQKIVPLSEAELDNVNDVKYTTWRELQISHSINDLIINSITPCIALTLDWIYVNGVDKYIFNNPILYDKIEISDMIHKKPGIMRRARTVLSDTNASMGDEIVISNRGIVIFTEYVGRTINSIPGSLKSTEYKKDIQPLFSNINAMSKYLFEIVYTLLCLNTKCQVVHGDLHLNNTTVHYMEKPYIYSSDIVHTNPYHFYTLDNAMYAFEDKYTIGTIIDFSRSFVNKDSSNLALREIQMIRIINYYKLLFPTFYQNNQKRLFSRMETHFDIVYKVFSAVDMYIHTDRLLKLIVKYPELESPPDVVALVQKIHDITKYYMTSVMETILTEDACEYPNYEILNTCFKPYIVDEEFMSHDVQITSMSWYKNDVTYSLSDNTRLPTSFTKLMLKKIGDPKIVELETKVQVRPAHIQMLEYIKYKSDNLKYKPNMQIVGIAKRNDHEAFHDNE
jgi:hypothetical protein